MTNHPAKNKTAAHTVSGTGHKGSEEHGLRKSAQSRNQEHAEKKGFAALPHEQVVEIAKKGGEARAEQLGHEGYVELGKKGGHASHKESSSKK